MSRIAVLDYIKVAMCIFIIVGHTPYLTISTSSSEWLYPFWMHQAVPVFWMISAFLFARSCDKHGSVSAADELSWKRLGPKFNRVLVPYIIVFAVMMAKDILKSSVGETDGSFTQEEGVISTALATVALFLAGGPGPGGYYIPCLFQMYIVLPFLCCSIRKHPVRTVLICFAIAVAWEAAACSGLIPGSLYRLAIVRYLPHLAAGTLVYRLSLAKGGLRVASAQSAVALLLGAVGAAYIAAVSYGGMTLLAVHAWGNANTFATLYSGSLFYFMVALFAGPPTSASRLALPRNRAVEYCSNACLHIYLFQMLWYYSGIAAFAIKASLSLPLIVAVSVIVCEAAGIAYYALETSVRRKISGSLSRKDYVGKKSKHPMHNR